MTAGSGDPAHWATNGAETTKTGELVGDRPEDVDFPRVRRNAVMRLCCLLLDAAPFPRKYRDQAIRVAHTGFPVLAHPLSPSTNLHTECAGRHNWPSGPYLRGAVLTAFGAGMSTSGRSIA
ncbi:hypothetical protein ACFVSQ_01810 [Streptomyces niveus]|uniref:hypothetical protein n=1 Tax=Streptomyces niveus TaxID=193462 RepID=UPI0036E43E87